MTDTDARFDRLEAALDKVAGRLGAVEGKLDRVDERVDRVDERLVGVDGRLNQVDGRLDQVEGKLGQVEGEVQKLRVLGEENTRQIKLIAEVQSHHGTVLEQHSRLLEQLISDVQPLKVLPDFLRTVVQEHERRIKALDERP